jgi:predicted MFS family arabinose efflux permease
VNPHLAAVLLAMAAFVVPTAARFVFTPILPLMQADHGLSIVAAGWLAAANHMGYLAGALTAVRLPMSERAAMRTGMVGVVGCVAGMALVQNVTGWFALRLLAGVAAAWLLIHTSAWGLRHAAASGRPQWSALVFSGAGLGIVATGVLCALWTLGGGSAAGAWLACGVLLAGIAGVVWPRAGDAAAPVSSAGTAATNAARHAPATDGPATAPGIPRLVLAYGLCGFGYVTAATFLPVLAREVLGAQGGHVWFWPLFGAAGIASTLLAARLGTRFGDVAVIRGSVALMGAGNAAMALLPGAWALAFGTVAVGCTFMVVTMLGLREARLRAPATATRTIGRMTIAWAAGQCAGPVVSAYLAGAQSSFAAALWLAAAALALGVAAVPPRAARSAAT